MKLQSILPEAYYTKDGDKIELRYQDDSEGDENRGWTVDKITAYIDGIEVGYLKLSYIPNKRFHDHYPNIFAWLQKISGNYLISRDFVGFGSERRGGEEFEYEKYSEEHKRKFVEILAFVFRLGREGTYVKQFKTDRELLQAIRDIEEKFLSGSKGVQFKRFKNDFVDKPVVDFIRVNEDFQRKRIAEALYVAGSKWMKEKGMKLYASGTQSDSAKDAWKHLEKKYKVRTTRKGRKGRRYLDIETSV